MRSVTKSALTDAELSLQAGEFLWQTAELSEAHEYLLPAVLKSLREAGARTVLDVGCGNGAVSSELAKSGFNVVGMDSSDSGIQVASQRHPDIAFFQSSIE